MGDLDVWDQHPSLPGLEREENQIVGVDLPLRCTHKIAAWACRQQRGGVAMVARCEAIRLNNNFGHSTTREDFINTATTSRENNRMAVQAPGSSDEQVGQFAKRGRAAPLYRRFPEVVPGCKTDKFAVGRPERQISALSAGDFSRRISIQVLDPQVSYRPRSCRVCLVAGITDDISYMAAVGRDDGILTPRAAPGRTFVAGRGAVQASGPRT